MTTKCTHFELEAWNGQTDRQTDRSQRCLIPFVGGRITNANKLLFGSVTLELPPIIISAMDINSVLKSHRFPAAISSSLLHAAPSKSELHKNW